MLLAVATSAIASTQTTIIPASRTGLSMARQGRCPGASATSPAPSHPGGLHVVGGRHRRSSGTSGVGLISENALFDSLTALSLLIAFYYALTGIACAVYFRRHLLSSVKSLLLIGVGPVVGRDSCWSGCW